MRSINIDQFMTPYNDLSEGYAAKARAQEGLSSAIGDIGSMLAQQNAQKRSLQAQQQESQVRQQKGTLDRASREGMAQSNNAAKMEMEGLKAERAASVEIGKLIAAYQDEADPAKRGALESQLAAKGVTIGGGGGAEKAGSYMSDMESGPMSATDSVPDVKLSPLSPTPPLGIGGGPGFGDQRTNAKALSLGGGEEATGADPGLASPFGLGAPKLSLRPMDTTPPARESFFMFKGQPIAPLNVTLGDVQEVRAAQAGSQLAPFAEGGTPDQNATMGKALAGATGSAALGVPVKDAVGTGLAASRQIFQSDSSKRHTPGGGGGGGSGAAVRGELSGQEKNFALNGYKLVLETNKANEKVERFETTGRLTEMIKNSSGLTDNLVKVELAGLYQKGVLSDKDFARSVGGESYLDQIRQWVSSGMEGEMSPELRQRFMRGLEAYRASAERDVKSVLRATHSYVTNPATSDPMLQSAWSSQFGQHAHLLEQKPGQQPGTPSVPTPGTTGNKEASIIDNDTAREMDEIDAWLKKGSE